jgi:DNA-binding MarR family transcriptional regulator
MVRRQYRQTEASRREAERLTAELEELAAEIFDRMPDDEPLN